MLFVTNVFEATFGESVELLVTGNGCSSLLFFCRLRMDQVRFIFSLLLIVSVATTTLGSAIKTKNPNGEVNTQLTSVITSEKFCLICMQYYVVSQ